MRILALLASALAAGALSMGTAIAKAPPGATGECKDGTYTEAKSKEGACSSHGGVKKWMGAAKETERPANATGECKDGTYTDAASKSGACSGHKGVKEWYGAAAPSEPAGKTAAKETRPSASETPSPGARDRNTVAQPSPSSPKSASTGAVNGKVWVNTETKVYHCAGDEWYGKTKKGDYMSESEAKASGARPSRGKECS